jgi:predicted hydrocarbon binding protein
VVNYVFDEEKGIIRDKTTGERFIMVSKTRTEDIFGRLSEIFQSGIEVLLGESSRTAGKHIADLTEEETKADINRLLNDYSKKFAQVGFGKIEICKLKPEKAEIGFRVRNNFFAEIREGESTYCSYIGGLVSGIYEAVLHKTPSVKEVKCIGNGDPYCEFQLAPK